jgi:formylglycine-generating enzyme required for sulfatase activity
MKTFLKLLSGWILTIFFQPLFAQNLMVIHQGNGTKIQLPLESIDSIRFVTLPPPVLQKIFQNNGNVLALAAADIDSITYELPNPQTLPQVSTQSVTALGTSSVYAEGAVLSDGGSPVTLRGFCWSLQPMPSLGNNYTSNGSGTGNFGASIAPLQAGSLYYVRAYATNSSGTAYGAQLIVNTQAPSGGGNLATVSTTAVQYTPAQGLTAICGGNVTADGGLAVTARGVCWAAGTTPTLNHNFTVDGAGAGTYTSNLSNLLTNTTYFVRAYATNDAGTAYGVSYAFTTIGLPVVSIDSVFEITAFSASVRSKVLNDGGAPITSRGVCWSVNPNPTTDLPTKTIDGLGLGSFTSLLNNLQTNSGYYLRSWARNSAGTTYSGQIFFTTATVGLPTVNTNMVSGITSSSAISGGFIQNDGGASIIARGVCWSTSPNPTNGLTTKTNDGAGTGNFISNLGGLIPNTVYYLRAYATNSAGTSYGNQISFSTLELALSTISTKAAFGITRTTASSGGNITSDGGGNISARGVCWNTSQNPTIVLTTKTIDGTGTGNYSSSLSGLSPNTQYFIRAYATNEVGTAYGNEIIILTDSLAKPTLSTTNIFSISSSSAASGGNVTNDGGSSVISRGVCWSSNPNPTSSLASKTIDGTGTGIFSSSLNNLNPNTKYYIRSYATNNVGTAYGNQLIFYTKPNIEVSTILMGPFIMGSPVNEPERAADELQHQVTLSSFQISKFETRNIEYSAFLNSNGVGSNGRMLNGNFPNQVLISSDTSWGLYWTGTNWKPVDGKENHPVVNVSWYGAIEFATYVGGRLPTEAEWEFACRAGSSSPFSTGACLNETQSNYWWLYPLVGCVNLDTSYFGRTQNVSSYDPNQLGAFNMHGNVWEWCNDWYGNYTTSPQTNPPGPSTGTARVRRGGSWGTGASGCRSAFRSYAPPDVKSNRTGFRLAFDP